MTSTGRWTTVAALLALATASTAAAHVVPQPAYLTPGKQTTVTFAAPNERPPHRLVGLTITAPQGVDLARAAPPPGWSLSIDGRIATWAGRPLARGAEEPFRIVASTSLAPGNIALHAVQRYDDSGLVRWTVAFTVLPAAAPAPKQHFLPAVVTAILGLIVIGLLLFRMRDRRGPRVQEE